MRIRLAWLVLLLTSAAAPAQPNLPTQLLAPRDGDTIPRAGVDVCTEAGRYCSIAPVTGKVQRGYWPFLAVRPEASSPRFWIQSRIDRVAPDGSFNAEASLGANENGARMHFDIFILAHHDPKRFGAFDILSDIPSECVPAASAGPHPVCVVSAPVTIYRSR